MKKPIYEIYRAANPFFGSLIKVYDIETLANCFLYIDADKQSFTNEKGETFERVNSFSICPYNNDLEAFVSYLLELEGMVGFNNLSFDSQVIQYILENWQKWKYLDGGEIAEIIYAYAQSLINNQSAMKFGLDYPEFKLTIPQLDLYKVHHFDNKNKMMSLKALQVSLNYWNVQEMPIDHKTFIKKEQLELVEQYCINDTLSTKELYIHKNSSQAIDLRKYLKQLYDINCMNWSNSKIGEALCLKFYCEDTGKNPKQIRTLRTHRDSISLKECFRGNIDFKLPVFQSLKTRFENTIITDTKKTEKISISQGGLLFEFGKGGIHCSLSGIFKCNNEDEIIIESDVGSLYPCIISGFGLFPAQLGESFVDSYKSKIVDVRMAEKTKKEKGLPHNKYVIEGLKESANSVYGKSNDKYSFLFDPKLTMSTTLIGQCVMTMLYETIFCNMPDVQIIMLNTDSLVVKIKKNKKDEFMKWCRQWEALNDNKLLLSYSYFTSMYIRDVNSYIAIEENGKTKLKGCFEKNRYLHQDNSFRIIPYAIEKYVSENISIEETIRNHKIIWDFLGRKKFKSNMKGIIRWIKDGELCEEQTQKVTRYYVAEKGKIFLKRYSSVAGKDRYKEEVIEKGYTIELANTIESENIDDYKIDYKYYIKEAQKIIDSVEKITNQLSLF